MIVQRPQRPERAESLPPLVTVIIPSYNAGRYLEQAISSALASGDIAVEVIVIDDGSSDDTWRVLDAFSDRIRTVRQEHGGPYRARNLGARMSRGQWLAFLDADDDWLPGKLAAQLSLADEGTALVYTDRLNFGDLSRHKERQSDNVTLWDGDVFEPLLLGNFITLSSVMVRKTWFEQLGGFAVERQGVQDWDLWLRLAAAGGKVRLCREPLTRYRIHPGQMTNEAEQRAADREAVLRRALASDRGRAVSKPVVRRAFAALFELAAENAVGGPGCRRPIGLYLKSAVYWPWNLRLYKAIVKCLLGIRPRPAP